MKKNPYTLTNEQRQYLLKIADAYTNGLDGVYPNTLSRILLNNNYGETDRRIIIEDILPIYKNYLKITRMLGNTN